MAKTGPTPNPDAPDAVARRRVAPVELAEVAIALPPPRVVWRTEVQAAYLAYVESAVAHALRAEDIPQVLQLFDLRDQMATEWELLQGADPDDAQERLRRIQAVKILDGMVARLSGELGIGPLARTRLGMSKVAEASALDKFMAGED